MSNRAARLAFFLSGGRNVGQPADSIIRRDLITNHVSTAELVIYAGTLPDSLARFYDVYLMGVNADGSKRYDFRFPMSVRHRAGDTPDYSVEIGAETLSNSDDPDVFPNGRADGDVGFEITGRDESGNAGVISWNLWMYVNAERTL